MFINETRGHWFESMFGIATDFVDSSSEDIYGLQQAQTTPSLKRFSATYDDAFSDVVSAFDNPINQDTPDGETSVGRDHKLLSFSMPSLDYVLLDYTYRQTSISLTAQLHGMFFLAESPWANHGDGSAPPAELTCYRRNLFQITGNITLPRTLRYIMTSEGKQIPIINQELVVSATESTEGNPVKLISVPWKTPANVNPPAADDKVEREPPATPLDMSAIQDMGSEYASFPFQWKRLQFRIATANNGRRKELQQHFTLHLKVMATLATGGKVSIATAKSGAVIVRGRSPRNFQSRKDTPLTGAGNHVRKSSAIHGAASQVNRTNSGESARPPKPEPKAALVKTEALGAAPAMSVNSFYDPHEFQMPLSAGLFDHSFLQDAMHGQEQQTHQAHQGAMTALPAAAEPALAFAAGTNDRARGYPVSSPDLSRLQNNGSQSSPVSAPQKLSLLDEDTPKQASISPHMTKHTPSSTTNMVRSTTPAQNSHHHPAKRQAAMPPPQRAPSILSLNVVSSPDESADLLYEYFPLSLDDWMPPVDAVYRPHVVHHIKTAPTGADGKGGRGGSGRPGGMWAGGRSKRYFSEDVG